MEDGKGARKSDKTSGTDRTRKSEEIATTPAREPKGKGTVTPSDQQINEREQQSSKKKREEQKRTMNHYFGGGDRVQPPSKGGTPVQSILLRRNAKTPERATDTDNTVESQLTSERVDNVGEEAGTNEIVESQLTPERVDNAGEGAGTLANMAVDLEGFTPGVRPKGKGSKKRDIKGNKEKTIEEQANKKTKARKPKIAFGPTEVATEKPIAYNECVVGFAIRVDKGNNTKLAFDKKLMEGLEFIQQYVDKRACFLPHEKDKKLEPILAKNDMPKYQVVMKGYFRIPNNNSFSNVQQENGRVVKGSGIMGFELDPQQCLEEASGDLRSMGCSIFFKKCQEVDTVSNIVFLGVPNSISEDTVKDTVDEVLQTLEEELIRKDKDYKLTVRQKEQWIKFAITKEYPGGMPWEDQAEKKKKPQAANNARLAFVFHVHRPDEQRLANLLESAKYRNLWHEHWGGVAFTVEQPGFNTPAGVKDRYIEMVQSHGAMQLSMGAATIPGIVTATRKFTLRLTPDENGQPREPTEKSLMDILRMMEIADKKVWLCVTRESNGIHTGYFSSVVEEIKAYVAAFIRCPAAQVYYWLKRKGCIGDDVNRLIRKCFTVEQQQKVTKSKYIKEKGIAVMKESDEDDIINAANKTGLFDMSLGLSDKEQRERMAKSGYNESAITFGEAKVGSMEAYNFSAGASITTVHAEKEGKGTSVASAKTMAKSVFSIATNITSESEDGGSDSDEETDGNTGVEIAGLEMFEEEGQSLTENMNRATADLQLGSSESAPEEGSQGEDTDDSEDPSYCTEDDPYDTATEHDINPEDYDEALEVSSGEFDAVHANKFQTPENFKQQLWNDAGPTVDSMLIQLTMIKENLEDDEAGMPFEWMGVSKELHTFLEEEVGSGISDKIIYINDMIVEMYQMNPTGVRTFDPLNEEEDEELNASKTQGTPPGAQKARPEDEAATPDNEAGRDKEGVLSLGMAVGD